MRALDAYYGHWMESHPLRRLLRMCLEAERDCSRLVAAWLVSPDVTATGELWEQQYFQDVAAHTS